MNKVVTTLLAATALIGVASSARAVTLISVENIGSILNESLALPAEDTPGSSIGFQQFFEFSLPVREVVTLSVSDSGFGSEKIVGGTFSVNNHETTGGGPLFIPAGSTIESVGLSDFVGGQSAELGPNTLSAGNYFALVEGTSGASPIHLAIDGTVTATAAVPEPSTWAMMGLGFGLLTFFGAKRRRNTDRLAMIA
jgi:hypothetical protein